MASNPQSQSVIDMFAQLGRRMKLSESDVERAIEHHRRNLEALEKSLQAAGAGASRLMTRQREMMKEALDEVGRAAGDFRLPSSDPQELVRRQSEFARRGLDTAMKNAGEVADIMGSSGSEAIDILRKRIKDAMEEIRDSFEHRG